MIYITNYQIHLIIIATNEFIALVLAPVSVLTDGCCVITEPNLSYTLYNNQENFIFIQLSKIAVTILAHSFANYIVPPYEPKVNPYAIVFNFCKGIYKMRCFCISPSL